MATKTIDRINAPHIVHGAFAFDKEAHRYTLGDKILPSITGILKECGYIDGEHFTEEARLRGSHVHQAIHYLNKGTLDWSTLSDAYIGYVMAYQKFLADWRVTPIICEEPMYHPEMLFAGTPDIIGVVLDNVPAIIEMKTGPIKRWTALQTAAQDMLMRAWELKPIRRRRFGLKLNKDGTYKPPKEFKEWQKDEAVFMNLNSTVQNKGLYLD